MRAAFARELAGIEQRIDREFRRAAVTLTVIAEACTYPTVERAELLSEHGRRLSLNPRKRRTTGMKEGNGRVLR
jgi:hypothetical protein